MADSVREVHVNVRIDLDPGSVYRTTTPLGENRRVYGLRIDYAASPDRTRTDVVVELKDSAHAFTGEPPAWLDGIIDAYRPAALLDLVPGRRSRRPGMGSLYY